MTRPPLPSPLVVLLLLAAFVVIVGVPIWYPDHRLGVITETAGDDAQLIRVELLSGDREIVFVPGHLMNSPLVTGEHVLLKIGALESFGAREVARATRVWRVPSKPPTHAWRLLDPALTWVGQDPLLAGVIGVLLLYAPLLALRLPVAAVGGVVGAWGAWLGVQAAPLLDLPIPGAAVPIVLGGGFLVGVVGATTRDILRELALRVVVAALGLTLAPALAALIGWPQDLVAGVVLISAGPFPLIGTWLVGAYFVVVGLQVDAPLAAHTLLCLCGLVAYRGATRGGAIERWVETIRLSRLRPTDTYHIPVEQWL